MASNEGGVVQSIWVSPTKHTEPDYAGTVPFALDGLFVLPERMPDGAGTRLHALRLRRGLPLWYTTLPSLAEVGLLGRFGSADDDRARLVTRVSGASALSWQLNDARGHGIESGSIAMDEPSRLLDVALTPRYLVLAARFDAGERGSGETVGLYRLGLAARHAHSRVQWLQGTQQGFPTLLHASEHGEKLVVDIARSEIAGVRAVTLLRFTLSPIYQSANVQAVKNLCLDWPTVQRARDGGPYRYLYAVTCQGAGEDGPALIRLDRESGHTTKRHLGFGRELGAPMLLPLASAYGQERTVLFAPVYDAIRDVSELLIFDVAHLDQQPVASIRLPAPVRSELRGMWLPAIESLSDTQLR